MADLDLSKSVLGFLPCIEVRWGTSNIVRYCRADEAQTVNGSVYNAVPELDFEWSKQDGGTKPRPVHIVVPLDLEPFDDMLTQTFPETEITVLEADFTDLAAVPRTAFVGHVAKTRARYRGKSKLMRVECIGRKHFIQDVSLGIKATDRCPWFFGDHVCGATVGSTTAEVSAITGTRIEFTTLANDDAGWGNGRYSRGYVSYDGLNILIRSHKVGQKKFILGKAPPQITGYTWVGKTVTIYEGCDKSVSACEYHGRQERFGGLGRKMPKYNPIIESRPEG
jgi:hypothetical protein